MSVLSALMVAGGTWVLIRLVLIIFKLGKASESEYRENRRRHPDKLAPWRGQVANVFDGNRDHRVNAGLAIDKKSNAWVPQGRLSDDALDSILKE